MAKISSYGQSSSVSVSDGNGVSNSESHTFGHTHSYHADLFPDLSAETYDPEVCQFCKEPLDKQ